MGNLMTSMWTGVSGLKVNQTSLNTTAHNISNIDTLGFTRQQILTGDFSYNRVGESSNSYMQVGLGTNMATIRQVRDVFLDKNYRLEIGRQGFYESQLETVSEIESLFQESSGEAFKTVLSDFWTAISEIAKEPESTVNRGVLVSTAKNFLKKADIIRNQLSVYQKSLNKQIQEKVDRVNEIGDTIKELNKAICTQESSGQQANDYRDARNQLLDELGGIVEITYQEDARGIVNINIEGTQFVTDTHVYHIETQAVTSDFNKDRENEINKYGAVIAQEIQDYKAANPGASDAQIQEHIKGMDEWKYLKTYGDITFTSTGIKYNGFDFIDMDGNMTNIELRPSDMLNVVWQGTGRDVCKLTGNYSSASNTNVGSLKGLLVSRGSFEANYTNIPVLPTEPSADDFDINTPDGQAAYDAAMLKHRQDLKQYELDVAQYNKHLDSSVMMATQAQFDQLIHAVVTTINDILCPNTSVSDEVVKGILTNIKGIDEKAAKDAKDVTVTLADGTKLDLEDILIYDEVKAGIASDKQSKGEALFERKGMDRYTEATMKVKVPQLDNDGNPVMDVDGITPKTDEVEVKVLVYNKEYATNTYSQFTLGQIEINEKVLNDYNLLPFTYNKYSGKYGANNEEVCQALLDAWDNEEILRLDPNTLTTNNFQDYYSAMTSGIAFRGKAYSSMVEQQQDTVETIDNKRQQTIGVSSEDELTNMIKYQHAYNASSRYINVINEMLGHVIDRLGH